jgi:threonine dehydrogenase-like Zn-dependent dehydrogenase
VNASAAERPPTTLGQHKLDDLVANQAAINERSATLHLEKLWIRDVTVTTGLVDTYTIPQLMWLISSGRLDPTLFAAHRSPLGDTIAAYDTFADAATTKALKVMLQGGASKPASVAEVAIGVTA